MSKASTQTGFTHFLFIIFFFFFLFLFPFFTSVFFDLLIHFHFSFCITFSIFPQPTAQEIIFMRCLILSDGVAFFPLGRAPLSCKALFLARFHNPFCAMKLPPRIFSRASDRYSFLVILLFALQFVHVGPEFVSTFFHFCAHLLRLAAAHQFFPFSASHSPSIACTISEFHPAHPFFLPNHDIPVAAFRIFQNFLTGTLALWHLHVLAAS